MANWAENIAKGRINELFKRVDGNDPANSAIILVPLSTHTTEAEAQDYDDLAAFLGGTANEQTGGGWARVVLTDAQLAAPAPDDTNNRYAAALPQVSFGSPTAGNDTAALAVCYDPDTTGGADSAIEVLTVHDFVVETDGNEVVLNAGDCCRST